MIVGGRREPIGGFRNRPVAVSIRREQVTREGLLLAARRAGEVALALWMGYHSLVRLVIGPLGTDGHIYYRAATAMAHGIDPWTAGPPGFNFNGPPITLLPLIPFTALPEEHAIWIWTVAAAIAGWWAIRRLGLPWYWILFPPLVDGINGANPNVIAFAALVAGWGWLAAVLKIYTVLPLVILGRWRELAVLGVVLVLTAPLAPWWPFLANFSTVMGQHAGQSQGGYSAWAHPVLVVPVAVSLMVIGRRRAAWLVIPGLWPTAGYHYGVFALGAAHPIVGLLMSLPDTWAWSAAIIGLGLWPFVVRVWPKGLTSRPGA